MAWPHVHSKLGHVVAMCSSCAALKVAGEHLEKLDLVHERHTIWNLDSLWCELLRHEQLALGSPACTRSNERSNELSEIECAVFLRIREHATTQAQPRHTEDASL